MLAWQRWLVNQKYQAPTSWPLPIESIFQIERRDMNRCGIDHQTMSFRRKSYLFNFEVEDWSRQGFR